LNAAGAKSTDMPNSGGYTMAVFIFIMRQSV
jgi:hypothetical protein